MAYFDDSEIYNINNLKPKARSFLDMADSVFGQNCFDEYNVGDYIDNLDLGSVTLEQFYTEILTNFIEYLRNVYENCRQDYIRQTIDSYDDKGKLVDYKLREEASNGGDSD